MRSKEGELITVGKLQFINNSYLYLLVFVLIPLVFLYGAKIYVKTFNTSFLSPQSTNQYRGLFILVVIISHIALQMQQPALMNIFIPVGGHAVSIFFFLSAYGITVSLMKNQNYLQGFLIKRILRVYLPFVIINSITVLALNFFCHKYYPLAYIFASALGINLQIDTTQWFIITIVLFYLFFWGSFRYFAIKKAPLIIVLLVTVYMVICQEIGKGSWWYESCFCFPLGIFFGMYREQAIKLFSEHYAITALLVSGSYFVLYRLHLWGYGLFPILKLMLSVIMILIIFFKLSVSSKVFGFIGALSLEMYLIHMKVYHLYFSLAGIKQSYSVYIYILSVVALAFILHRFFNFISFSFEQKYKI